MKRLLMCLIGLVSVCFAGVLCASAAEIAEGVLKDVKGDVEIRKRGGQEWMDAHNDMKIGPGDIISTGITGKATLLFKNSESKILPLTQFVLGRSVSADTQMYTELYLLAGKVSTHVIKTKYTGIKNKFNIITPTAVVGVRGTIETVEYNPGMGTKADIRDGKGYAAPVPVDRLPQAVLELLGLDTGTIRDTQAQKGARGK